MVVWQKVMQDVMKTMSKPKVSQIQFKDNFLPTTPFKELQKNIMGVSFPWYMGEVVNPFDYERACDQIDNVQLVHMFYENDIPLSQSINLLDLAIERLDYKSLLRIKANCTLRTPTIIKHGLHRDFPFPCNTAILYINTNDGYTEFEDGTVVESVENRLVVFPTTMKHTGTTCTDQSKRMVINFNYF